MGVVHLARKPGGPRVALKVLRPHIVGDDEARARLAREVGSLERIRSRWIAEIVDADPWGPTPYVATRYVPGLSLHDFVPEEGPIEGADLRWFASGLAEGVASVHAVGRAAPRRETVQRADGGPRADPDRLRSGPRRGRPEADPHRLVPRYAGLPRPRDPPRRRRDDRVRRALLGGDRGLRRHRAPALRARAVDGDHGPGTPRRARPERAARRPAPRSSRRRSIPTRPAARPLDEIRAWLAEDATDHRRRRRGAGPPRTTRSRSRWRSLARDRAAAVDPAPGARPPLGPEPVAPVTRAADRPRAG